MTGAQLDEDQDLTGPYAMLILPETPMMESPEKEPLKSWLS